MASPVWYELPPTRFPNSGCVTERWVLEFHEDATAPGPPIELHLLRDAATGTVGAFWTDDNGRCLGFARVGRA
jgi:hypothetical protein